MEHGYFHPSLGYWQTTSDPSEDVIAGFPEGTVEVPLKPGPDHQWTGDAWVHITPGPPPVPQAVSRFQARAALKIAGLLSKIEEQVAQADPIVQIAWTDAVEFRRNSPTIAELAKAVGLTEDQIDELFRNAAKIEA